MTGMVAWYRRERAPSPADERNPPRTFDVGRPITRQTNTRSAKLNASELRRGCDPAQLPFTTSAELPDSPLVFRQDPAVAAIRFGIGIRRDGYNILVLGPTSAGKYAVMRRFLEEQAASEPPARDWCYVYNFEQPHRPQAIQPDLLAGQVPGAGRRHERPQPAPRQGRMHSSGSAR